MKKTIKPFSFVFLAVLLAVLVFPLINAAGIKDVQKVSAYETGYRVRVEIETLLDDDQLTGAEIWIHTKKDYGRSDNHYYFYESDDISAHIDSYGDKYTSDTVDCGNEFPYCVSLQVKHGNVYWDDISCSFNIRVYINDILVAEENRHYSGFIISSWAGDREFEVYVPNDKLPNIANGIIDQYGVLLPAPEVTYESNYRVKVNIRVTEDADDWNSAYIWIYTKRNNSTGDSYLRYTSADIKNSIEYTDANYTHQTIKTGMDFPYRITIYTDLGSWGQKHSGAADVTVYINDINVASKHISYGGWGRNKEENDVYIDETKYPYPKDWHAYYSTTVDPSEEESTTVNLTPVDQYGVGWTADASRPISVENRSFPGEDVAEKLDAGGYKWKLNSTKTDNHSTNYYFIANTGSSVYPTREEKVTVKFIFPLHVYVKLNGETLFKGSGYAGETLDIPDIKTPLGYVVASYTKEGVGTVEKDDNGKYHFTFVGDSVTLTPKLKAIAYTIKYNQNGEGVTRTMLDKTANYDKTIALATNQYKREGYTFTGWNTKADGSGTAFADKEKIKNLASTQGEVVTLYAQWKKADDASVTASLFTDGSLGLLFGGIVAEAGVIAIIVLVIAKARKARFVKS